MDSFKPCSLLFLNEEFLLKTILYKARLVLLILFQKRDSTSFHDDLTPDPSIGKFFPVCFLERLYLLGFVAKLLVIFLTELQHLPAVHITGGNLGSASLSLGFLSFVTAGWE